MKTILIITVIILGGCTMTPQQRQAMGQALYGVGQQMSPPSGGWTVTCINMQTDMISTFRGLACPRGYLAR